MPAAVTPNGPDEITDLLLAWSRGDANAGDRLLPAIYADLHRQASSAMRREGEEHTLQPTALVHEAYMRLVDQKRVVWKNRSQFFGVASQMMRRVLVDHARERLAAKRGAGRVQVSLSGVDAVSGSDDAEVIALHEALERLARFDDRQARIVELRYFGGLDIEEAAQALGISPATVKREWTIARAWLRRELAADAP
jgi:RNA polymerase sigma factor (TIGR02999 family)